MHRFVGRRTIDFYDVICMYVLCLWFCRFIMAAIDKVRIVVVGDAGVGKTSLVHLISHNEPISHPYWTIGCSVEVKLHEYKVGTPSEKLYFVELWDIGGWTAHKNSRSIFYNPVHGIILVHDLTNRKSQQNLRKWLSEILNRDNRNQTEESEYDAEQFAGSTVPMIVIGTKLDLFQPPNDKRTSQQTRVSSIADECGADELNLDCTHVRHLAAGTSNAVRLSKFFDKVIQHRFHSRENSNPTDRRQRPSYGTGLYSKSSHSD